MSNQSLEKSVQLEALSLNGWNEVVDPAAEIKKVLPID